MKTFLISYFQQVISVIDIPYFNIKQTNVKYGMEKRIKSTGLGALKASDLLFKLRSLIYVSKSGLETMKFIVY